MAGVRWDDDDDFPPDFFAEIDKLVDEHHKNVKAGPVQGSSQNVAHPPTSNVLSAPGIQDNNNIVHHLYGPLQRPSSGNSTGNGHMGPKAWRPENHQRNNQLYGSSVQHQNSGNQQGRGPFTNNQTWQKPYTNSSSNFRPPVNQQVFNSNIQTKGYGGRANKSHSSGVLASPIGPSWQNDPNLRRNENQTRPIQAIAHVTTTKPDVSKPNPKGIDLPWTNKTTQSRSEHSQPTLSQPQQGVRLRDLYGRNDAGSGQTSNPTQTKPPAQSNLSKELEDPTGLNVLLQAQLDGLDDDDELETKASKLENDGKQAKELKEQEAAFHALKKQFEAKERENLELQRRVSQFSASTSMPSTYMPDFQRQLDTFNQQMAFKEQELLEERRRHGEFAEKLEQSKIEAQRLQADYSRSETQRTQLQNELSKVQATRDRERAVEATSQETSRQKRKLDQITTQKSSDDPMLTEKQEKLRELQVPPRPEKRSIGPNTPVIQDTTTKQNPRETLSFPQNHGLAKPWQISWASLGAPLANLLYKFSDGSWLKSQNIDECHLERMWQQIKDQVDLVAWIGDEAAVNLTTTIIQFLQTYGTKILRLEIGEVYRKDILNLQSHLSAALNLLSAIISNSEFVLSTILQESNSEESDLNVEKVENLVISDRVTLYSKGVLLRPLARLKDRPPDKTLSQSLQQVGGLTTILVDLQNSMNEQTVIQDFVEVQGALLKVFQSLANHKTPTKFLVQLGQSGCLKKLANLEEQTFLPSLLDISYSILKDQTVFQSLLAQRFQANTQTQMEGSQAGVRSMGYDILEVPLLCLRNSNLNLLRKSLNLVSALLEKREWDPLRHLLAEDPGRGIGPPLSQRIMQCANTLFRDIEGGDLKSSLDPLIEIRGLYWTTLQECLLFLRCLFGEESCARAVADDLTSTPSSQRISISLTSQLADLEENSFEPPHNSSLEHSLSAWSMCLGLRYTQRPFYAKSESKCSASVKEIAYLAQSIRRRILHHLENTT